MEKFTPEEIKEVVYNRYVKDALEQIPKGAFLTVKTDQGYNVMTIGWSTIGVMWGRPVFAIGIRPSRYTYQFLEEGHEFAVSIPTNQKLKKQLGFCGTKSGKTVDKFKDGDFECALGIKTNLPLIRDCGIYYECKIIGKHQLIPGFMNETIETRYYPQEDHHMMFYGEILGAYKALDN